ncbi:ATP-binding protein [Actinocorallia populi]|uniref:ATP-binding protein n=1 Tax=Actinocorallia populi TaxID=2079200 RepID=UPI00130050EE|nr:AAA family ATPase [Actinocorallia populi]
MARPGRSPAPIPEPDTPLGRFAQGLRDLRDQAGDPGYEALARESERLGTPYSATSLRTAASGRSLPSWKVTETFVRACVEFARRHPHRAHPAALRWTPEALLPRWTALWHEISFHPPAPGPPAPPPTPRTPKDEHPAPTSPPPRPHPARPARPSPQGAQAPAPLAPEPEAPENGHPADAAPEDEQATRGTPQTEQATHGTPQNAQPTHGAPENRRTANDASENKRVTRESPENGRKTSGASENERVAHGVPEWGWGAGCAPEGAGSGAWGSRGFVAGVGVLSRFVGREEELAEGERALESARLVTVTGPGGVGKTRLVMRLAERAAGRFPDGVRIVELAELDSSMPVGQAVAAALGVRVDAGREPLEAVAQVLDGRRTLLVLDNCEHVLPDVAGLVQVLAGASRGVCFLASSRQALNIAGERILTLGPLPLPRDGGESAAVELFADRAAAVVPGFRLTDANRDAVHRVCHRLDGLPLALEIAARLLRFLTPHELLDRLGQRFRLLGEAGAERTAPARHRTLRAVLDWSHDLCSDDERLAWERLSVCAGTVALADAEALVSAEGAEPGAAFEAIAGLVDKSLLLRVESGGRSRLHLLETVRMYGREKLADSAGEEAARRRHRERYLGLAVEAERAYASPRQQEWLLRLRDEHADLRQAFTPSPPGPATTAPPGVTLPPGGIVPPGSTIPPGGALPFGGVVPAGFAGSVDSAGLRHQGVVMEGVLGLWLYWIVSGNLGECVLWARAVTGWWPVPPGPELVEAWAGMSWSAAVALLVHGDRPGAGRLLDRVERVVPLEEGPRWVAAAVRQLRGLSALFSGDIESAEAYSEAALRTGGHRPGLLTGQQALAQIGLCASARGAREEAVECFLRALELSEACGETWHRSYLLWTLSSEYAEAGHDDRAVELLRRSLELKHSLDDRLGMATVSESLARLLARHGDPGKAALLLGAAQALWQPAGTLHLWGFERLLRSREQSLDELRRVLGEERFTAEYLEGGRLGLPHVLELALPRGG